jgi:hypothetical protein
MEILHRGTQTRTSVPWTQLILLSRARALQSYQKTQDAPQVISASLRAMTMARRTKAAALETSFLRDLVSVHPEQVMEN